MNRNFDLMALFSEVGLSPAEIVSLAFETGFCTRNSGKIMPHDFVYTLCRHALKRSLLMQSVISTVCAGESKTFSKHEKAILASPKSTTYPRVKYRCCFGPDF